MAPAALGRPGRAGHRRPRPTCSPSPGCTWPAGSAADGTRVLCARLGRRHGRPPGRPARQVHPRRLVGPGLDPVRLGRRSASSATTATPSARRRSCGSCPSRASRSTLLTNGGQAAATSTRTSTARCSPSSPDVDMPRPLTPPEPPVDVDVAPYVGTLRARLGAAWRCSRATTGRTLRTTITGPLAELVPDPVEEYPLVPLGPGLFAGQAAGGRDVVPGDLLRAADRRALPALRCPGHAEGRLMDLASLLDDTRDARRVRVAVGRPRGRAAVGRRRRRGSGTRLLGVAPERIVARRCARTCAGGSATVRRGCWCSATTTPSGRSARSPRTRARSTAACCAAPAAST